MYSTTGGSTSGSGGSGVPTGPTGGYAGSGDVARNPGDFKPKGKNITEGGFDSSAPNASFNNAEIGSKKDPGRVAEANYQLRDAQPGADAGRPKDKGTTGDSQYGALNREEAA